MAKKNLNLYLSDRLKEKANRYCQEQGIPLSTLVWKLLVDMHTVPGATEIDEATGTRTNLALGEDVFSKLDEFSKKEGIPKAEIVRRLIDELESK